MGQTRNTRAVCSAVLLAALWFPTGLFIKASKKNKYEKIAEPVRFGAATGRIGNSCFFFLENLTGGGFFTGVERLKTPQGPALLKGAQLLKYYPDQIAVDIEGRSYECQPRMSSTTPPLNTWNFMKLLWFKAGWEKDMQLQPAEKLRYDTFEPVWWPQQAQRSWTYHLTMQTKGVALTDDLLITVLSDEGKELVRLTGNVATGDRSLPSPLFASQPARDNKDSRK